MNAKYWSFAYRKCELVDESELLVRASAMLPKRTIKARLVSISYQDMKAAVEKTLGAEFSYSCHGDIFDISRHSSAT